MNDNCSNFSLALIECRKGCFDQVTKLSYDRFQTGFHNTRMSTLERDNDMKTKITAQLSREIITSSNERKPLTYIVELYDEKVGRNVLVDICERCFVNIYNHKKFRAYSNWKQEIKERIATNKFQADVINKVTGILQRNQIMKSQFENVLDAKKSLFSLQLSNEQLQIACLPDNAGSQQAFFWMSGFFSSVGDYAPNRDELVQLPGIYTKQSIYEIMELQIKTIYTGDEHEMISLSQFKKLWIDLFPKVRISKFCQVTGKCATCHWIYERQENFKTEADLADIKYLSAVHKIQIVEERKVYIKKRELAQNNPQLYMSIIIDGMAQDHCALPHYANKNNPNNRMKQKITGIKQHGFSRSFYRSYPHIKSGTNLAIEVLLHEIEARMMHCENNNKLFPKKLFLQIDGGPENTSKSFYAFCEKLVKDGIFDEIDVSRLPVGHTHEDIDALFGVLWRAAQNKTFITPDEWREMAMKAFYQEYVAEEREARCKNGNYEDMKSIDSVDIEANCGDIDCKDSENKFYGCCAYCKRKVHVFCGIPFRIDEIDEAVQDGPERICSKCQSEGKASEYISDYY